MDNVDLADPDTYANGLPHEVFRRLRTEAPVSRRSERAGPGYWAVTRHADVCTVLRTPSVFSSWRNGALLTDPPPEFLPRLREGLMHRDPPEHTALRAVVTHALNPRRMRRLARRVSRQAGVLLDRVRGTGRCDFATEVAERLPLFVICETLGVPAEDRSALYGLTSRILGSELTDPAAAMRDAVAAAEELRAYAAELGRRRRAAPADDLVSELLGAEIDGRRLTDGEFQAFFLLLFNAGGDTTRSLLCHGLDLLLDRPDLMDRLRGEPSMIPTAVDEMARVCSPVIQFRRTANRDTELGGVRIAEGDKVVVFFPAANHDETVFADPQRFDPIRKPNPHVSFGFGTHYCLGAMLARLECAEVFGGLLRGPGMVERAGPLIGARSNFVRRVRHLEITYA